MNRSTLFALGLGAAVICLIIAVLYWAGVMPPDHKVHIKHGILFLGLAVIAGLFALVNRPIRTSS
jgi:hypothetical protein